MLSKLQRLWFSARAVAESVKSLSWRYVTGANPFPLALSPKDADTEFIGACHQVLDLRHDVIAEFSLRESDHQITSSMRLFRTSPLQDRFQLYLESRIREQRRWYSSRAEHNRNAREWWFFAILVAQLFAFVSAVFQAARPAGSISFMGFAATLASSFLSWLQVKRHEDLSESYAVAAQELSFVEAESLHLDSEEALAGFVRQAEDLISREHTLWVVRRHG
jgi:hypothetical protein